MILKVQLPLAGTPDILVYDKRRTFERIFPAHLFSAPVVDEMRPGDKVKAYYEATLKNGVLTFGKMVADQQW